MSAPREELRYAAAALRLDLISPAAVVDDAVELLADLPTNRPLAELAGVTASKETSREVVAELLMRALEAEGLGVSSDREAGEIVARRVCRSILTGEIAPYHGARLIWWNVVDEVPELDDEFGMFEAYASGWEDEMAHRPDYEADIRQAAADVLNDSESTSAPNRDGSQGADP